MQLEVRSHEVRSHEVGSRKLKVLKLEARSDELVPSGLPLYAPA